MSRSRAPYTWLVLALLGALGASLGLGSEWVSPVDLARLVLQALGLESVDPTLEQDRIILWSLRMPRAALMALVGASLGSSGAAYQGLLRNPLADPYLIGVAPGAALGAAIAIVFLGPTTALGYMTVPACAFVGALVTVAVVYRVARVGNSTPVTTLILAGVAVGAFASAATSFVMLLREDQIGRVIYFLWGGFGLGGWQPVLALSPYVCAAVGTLILFARPLNALQFGDEQASQLGLDVERLKLVLIAAATLAAAAAVALTGIIGFVGLIVPHVLRVLTGPDYRRLIPFSALGGATLLLLADTLQRSLPILSRTPVGVVTAVLGAPLFLVLLRRNQEANW